MFTIHGNNSSGISSKKKEGFACKANTIQPLQGSQTHSSTTTSINTSMTMTFNQEAIPSC
jgi:hypothetical protein